MGDVTECGLKGYENRHDAKQAAKQHHHNHVRAFKCERCGYWHLGELPERVVRGEITAGEFYQERATINDSGRSPASQLRRRRLSAAALLERDHKVLAEMLADTATADRDLPAWRTARDDAARWLTGLRATVRRLADEVGGV